MSTPIPSEEKISLSVLIDNQSNRMIFAEAGSDFVDVLFSFMTLPLGTIVKLLNKHFDAQQAEAFGSLNNLYESLRNLSSSNFWSERCKLMLLNPKNVAPSEGSNLKIKLDDFRPTQYNQCSSIYYNLESFSEERCRSSSFPMSFTGGSGAISFTVKEESFIIAEDLRVMENLAGLSIKLLNEYGVERMDKLEEKKLEFGLKEIMQLLLRSLLSRTPLADLVLQKPLPKSHSIKHEPISPQNQTVDRAGCFKKIVIKIMMQKSTHKLLFAQAGDDFIDFLFSLLTIPLGTVVTLLGGHSNLGSIDKLYKSIYSLGSQGHLSSQLVQSLLLKPELPHHYLSKHQLLPLTEMENSKPVLSDPKEGKGSFVKGPAMFMVTDDLGVTLMSSISSIFFLNRLKISPSDVEELVLDIGTREAIDILRAILTSRSSALTNAFQHLILKKKPKQEP